jgi:hypothetical protein
MDGIRVADATSLLSFTCGLHVVNVLCHITVVIKCVVPSKRFWHPKTKQISTQTQIFEVFYTLINRQLTNPPKRIRFGFTLACFGGAKNL